MLNFNSFIAGVAYGSRAERSLFLHCLLTETSGQTEGSDIKTDVLPLVLSNAFRSLSCCNNVWVVATVNTSIRSYSPPQSFASFKDVLRAV